MASTELKYAAISRPITHADHKVCGNLFKIGGSRLVITNPSVSPSRRPGMGEQRGRAGGNKQLVGNIGFALGLKLEALGVAAKILPRHKPPAAQAFHLCTDTRNKVL